ncbi:MAG: PaaI family thioesterase [Bacteroidota bacterium]
MTIEQINRLGDSFFPEHLGIKVVDVQETTIVGEMELKPYFLAPNRYLHAGCIVSLADTLAGYASMMNLPKGAISFTTIELKTNFLRTLQEGVMQASCVPEHLGRKTQVWKVTVSAKDTGKKMALFSCTQMMIYP